MAPDTDVQYYAWEDDLTGYTSSNPIEDHLTVVDGEGAITNTTTQSPPQFGSLSISQEVVSGFTGDTETSQLTSGDLNRSFLFTITLTDENDDPLQGNALYGDLVFVDGEASVRLSHNGGSVTIPDIPAGYHYTVTQAATGGFQAQQSTLSGTIVAETQAQADFVTKKLIVETTSITLEKEVTGFENYTESFRFDISLEDLLAGATYSLSNGETYDADDNGLANVTVYLQDDDQISLLDIPVGAKYIVTESAGDYISSYAITDANSLNSIRTASAENTAKYKPLSTSLESVDKVEVSGVEKIEDVTITFTNKIVKDLTISNTVDITYGNENQVDYENQEFEFEIEFTQLGANKEYTVEYSQAGVAQTETETFTTDATQAYTLTTTLKHGQSVTIKDLPTNATYQITEKAVKFYIASYTATGNADATIAGSYMANLRTNTALSTSSETVDSTDTDVRFAFTNTYAASDYVLPNTGLSNIKILLAFIMFGALLFATIYFIYSKKNKKFTKCYVTHKNTKL